MKNLQHITGPPVGVTSILNPSWCCSGWRRLVETIPVGAITPDCSRSVPVAQRLALGFLPGLIVICLLAWGFTPVVQGASLYWTGAVNGYWSEPGNWDPSATPQNGDNVFFVRDNDAHRVMTNDLINLSIGRMHFGVFWEDQGDNDYNYELNGNSLSLSSSSGASINSTPDGSSTVTINCPLVFQDGGYIGVNSKSINPLFQETARLVINGPLAVNAGVLRLEASGTYLFANQDGRLVLAGSLSGAGDVQIEPYSFSSVEFIGPANNTLQGTMYLSTEDGGEIIFNKTAGYVVTNVLSVVSRGEATLKLNLANQFGPDSTILLNEQAILHLNGTSQLVGNLVFTNDLLPSASPPLLDTGNTTCLLRNGIISRVTKSGGHPPIIQGSLNLTAGNHIFDVEADAYAGLDIQAEISGAGGFTKTGEAALLVNGVNTFIGNATVAEGVVDAYTPTAFGAPSGGVTLNGGSVTLRNLSINGETLVVQGQEPVASEMTGSLLTSIGVSAWMGAIELDTNLVVVGGDMTFTGPISGTGGLGCFSGGTMTLGGPLANSYTGITLVRCPLLQLNKPFGIHAYAGPLEVGGGFGGTAEVRWLNFYQTPNTPLTLYANGFVNLTTNVEDFGPVTFNGGLVQTAPGISGGYFSASSTITANPATSPAVLNGNLALSGSPAAYFIVSDGVAEPDLQINAVILGANIRKQGPGTLLFSAPNQHTGYTLVEDGILHADNPLAFGSTSGNTIVWPTGSVRLGGVDGMPEAIQLDGPGFQGTNGALQVAVGGTMSGGVWLNGPATINTLPGSSLAINAAIGGTGPLTKTGSGNLTFSGSSANNYSGGTIASAGTLHLFKSQNIIAAPGHLTIGPTTAASPATVRCYNTGMLTPGIAATVNANSLLDLNGNNQLLAQLNLNDGGNVQTLTGTLSFPAGGSVNVGTLSPGLPGLQHSASISGRLALPTLDYLTFNVSGYGLTPLSPDPELAVPAIISGGGNIIKNGLGAMRLSGANTFNDSPPNFSGDLYIYAGTVIAADNSALGGTAGWTWVYNGARLALVGNITISGEALFLNSTNTAALDNPGGHNAWIGPVSLSRDSGIGVNLDWSLTVQGTVSGSGSLTKLGAGLLRLGGSANNTHSGNTYVDAGTLYLTKFPNMQAVPANLIIGRPGGGSSATVMHVNSDLIWGDVTVNNGGLLNVNGYNEFIGRLTLNGGGDVQTGAGTLYVVTNLTVNTGGFADQSVISGRLGLFPGLIPFVVGSGAMGPGNADCLITAAIVQYSSAAGLLKNGSGVLRLTGINTYSGQTYINEGTLWVDGSQPQSPVTMDHETRLQGSGIIGHFILNGSSTAIAPGSSPGTLTCSNFNASDGSGTLEIELNGTLPGLSQDQLNVRGTVDLTGLKLTSSLGFNSAVSDQFVIINNDGSDAVTGTFTGLPQNGKLHIGGELFQINYSGGTGNDVVLTRLITPPRPQLTIERASTNSFRLVWATNDPPFRLLASTNLTSANWTVSLPLPVVSGTNNVVTNTTSGGEKFYRLVNP